MTTISKIGEKLQDPAYRSAYVASQINIGLPFQIRALLKSRGKTQEWLAEKTGMLQPRISSLMTPGKTRPNIETLRRLADAFDCGLAVRFVPFSELARWSLSFDPESFEVPEFKKDSGFFEGYETTASEGMSKARLWAINPGAVRVRQMPIDASVRKPVRLATTITGTNPASALVGKIEYMAGV